MLPSYLLALRADNGTEFTSRAFMAWATEHGVRHILIQPGRPIQSGYIESFNGKFRDECLNEQWFQTLSQARTCIADGAGTTTKSGHTAAWLEYHRLNSRNSIGVISMLLQIQTTKFWNNLDPSD